MCAGDDWEAQARENLRLVTYQLHIRIASGSSICVGRLGGGYFPAGCYIYTGSARRNLVARIRRHLSAHKTLRWHIDYLLNTAGVSIAAVELSEQPECVLNQSTDGEIIMPGFGASDCRAHCGSHLKYLGQQANKHENTV